MKINGEMHDLWRPRQLLFRHYRRPVWIGRIALLDVVRAGQIVRIAVVADRQLRQLEHPLRRVAKSIKRIGDGDQLAGLWKRKLSRISPIKAFAVCNPQRIISWVVGVKW